MATDKTTLKSYFETGDTPTQQQFAELIDAMMHVDADRGFVRTVEAGTAITIGSNRQHAIIGNMSVYGVASNAGEMLVTNGMLINYGAIRNDGFISIT
ncbi:hypothetical protein BH09BAC1_BH09BAC1_05040 [soil metagenome]